MKLGVMTASALYQSMYYRWEVRTQLLIAISQALSPTAKRKINSSKLYSADVEVDTQDGRVWVLGSDLGS
jgi:hypothetical protein